MTATNRAASKPAGISLARAVLADTFTTLRNHWTATGWTIDTDQSRSCPSVPVAHV